MRLILSSSSVSTLVSYIDADWVGCPNTRRSTFGYDNLVSWESTRQSTISCSSVEAEYRGIVNVVVELC